MPQAMVLTVDDIVIGVPAWLALAPMDPPMSPSAPMRGHGGVGSASSAPSADERGSA
jgi:hypothetical protein